MAERRPKRPRDINQLAASIVEESTEKLGRETAKLPTKVSAGRKGGGKGGKARAKKLTPEQRQAIARKAARARWNRASLAPSP